MTKLKDRAGSKFGQVTVLENTYIRDNNGRFFWHCICDCGKKFDSIINSLVTGNTTSCGCYMISLMKGGIRRGKPNKQANVKALPIEEVVKRLPSHIIIKVDTYQATTKPATFIDELYGEFTAFPARVFENRAGHPKRNIKQIHFKTPPKMDKVYEDFLNKYRIPGKNKLKGNFLERAFQHNIGGVYHNSVIFKYDPYRPDIKLTNSIYIECDGLRYHTIDNVQKKEYHFCKRNFYESRGIRLLQFYSNEILGKTEIVKSIVNNQLGKNIKIGARKCTVVYKVPQTFFKLNHLMGIKKGASVLGLIYNNEIVCALSYSIRNNTCNIERFCCLNNVSVVGGFSRLFKTLLKKHNNINIFTNWVDLRYGTGEFLKSLNFKHIKDTLGWKWTDYTYTYNRLYCRASDGLTERENAEKRGLYKIYDAGQRLYIYDRNSNE